MTTNATRIRTLDDFLDLLPGYKTLGNGKYLAKCPGHDDKNPSLSITFKNRKILLHDHGGCMTENVVSAMGLTLADLSLNGDQPELRKEVAIYKYLGFEVVRYEPKDFRQRRSDGNGGYIWNLDTVTPTLYHQNELTAAIANGATIYIVEGEKDVDRLRSLGLTATCNAGGAGKWKDSYTTALKGADLAIIPDNDPPGKDHAAKIAKACHGIAARVRVLELPGPGKDISDYIDSGCDVAKLQTLAEACPTWTPTLSPTSKGTANVSIRSTGTDINLRCMKGVKREYVTWLWEPYIAIGKLTLLEGDPGIGKSWITLAIATAISLGKGLPGQAAREPGTVMLASAEDGLGDTIGPRLDAMKADDERIHAIDGAVSFDDAGFALIESYIDQVKPKLLIIDPLVAYLGAGMDFHRANETRPVMSHLAKLAGKYELAILAVRHLAKGGMNKAIYRGIGSIDFTAACRSVLLAGCDSENANNLAIVHIKSNLAAKGASQGYQLRDDNFYWTGESTLTSTQILAGDDSSRNVSEIDEAIAFLKEELADGPVPARDVYRDAEGAAISKRTLERAKAQTGVVARRLGEKGKRGAGGWAWQLPDNDLHRQHGDLNNQGDNKINIATNNSGDLKNSEANKLTEPKSLATLIKPDFSGQEVIEIGYDPSVKTTADQLDSPDLAASRGSIIELWNYKGSPVVHLNPGENCYDLEKLLRHSDILPRNVEAVNKWYIENGGEK